MDRNDIEGSFFATSLNEPVCWHISDGLTPYQDALAEMEALAGAIKANKERERVWLVEHPALYTAGTSANPSGIHNCFLFSTDKNSPTLCKAWQ